MSSNKCILFWRTSPALPSEGVGSQWTQHQPTASSESSEHRYTYIYNPNLEIIITNIIDTIQML